MWRAASCPRDSRRVELSYLDLIAESARGSIQWRCNRCFACRNTFGSAKNRSAGCWHDDKTSCRSPALPYIDPLENSRAGAGRFSPPARVVVSREKDVTGVRNVTASRQQVTGVPPANGVGRRRLRWLVTLGPRSYDGVDGSTPGFERNLGAFPPSNCQDHRLLGLTNR